MTVRRQPPGIPVGGQFSASPHDEADVTLDEYQPLHKVANGQWIIPETMDTVETGRGDVVYATPATLTRRLAIGAVIRDIEQEDAIANKLDYQCSNGNKTTLLLQDRSTGVVSIREGTGAFTKDGRLALRAKGSPQERTPLPLSRYEVLGVAQGYGSQDAFAVAYRRRAEFVPEVSEIDTFEDLPRQSFDDFEENGPVKDIAAVYMFEPVKPDDDSRGTPGCLFLATEREASGGSIHGFVWVPPGTRGHSGVGRVSESELRDNGGCIGTYVPGSLTLDDCIRYQVGEGRSDAYLTVTTATPKESR